MASNREYREHGDSRWAQVPGLNRRVVTGLNEDGESTIIFESPLEEIPGGPGQMSVVWRTSDYPVDNQGSQEASTPFTGTMFKESSSVFMIIRSDPTLENDRQEDLWHATDTIDYLYVVTGHTRFSLQDGSSVELGPGDLLVDRGVVHQWQTLGTEPLLMVAVVINAEPLGDGYQPERDGRVLDQFG